MNSVTGGVEGCASGKGGVGVEDIVNVDLGEEHLGEEDSIHQGKGADSGERGEWCAQQDRSAV